MKNSIYKNWWFWIIILIIIISTVLYTQKNLISIPNDNTASFKESETTCINLLQSLDIVSLDKLKEIGIEPYQMQLNRIGRGNLDWSCSINFKNSNINNNETLFIEKEKEVNMSLDDIKFNILYAPWTVYNDELGQYPKDSIVDTPKGKRMKFNASFEEENDKFWKVLVLKTYYYYDKNSKILTRIPYLNNGQTNEDTPDWFLNIVPNFFVEKNNLDDAIKKYPVLQRSISLMDLKKLINSPPLYSGFGWSSINYYGASNFVAIDLRAGFSDSTTVLKTNDNSDACTYFQQRLDYCNQHCSVGVCCCSYCNKGIGIFVASHGGTTYTNGTVDYHHYDDDPTTCDDFLNYIKSDVLI